MTNCITNPYILCVGLGWFPKTSGGLDRYVYELTHYLAAAQDQVELCGVGLPDQANPVKLTNLASPDEQICQRLWSIRTNFLRRCPIKPDAINLHFALNSFPLLNTLPDGVPITFNFHGPWALESQQEGAGKLDVFLKHWLVEKKVYSRCDRFIVLSKAFGNILNQKYQVPWSKIQIIPGGVNLSRFQLNLSRQQARVQLNWPQDRAILFAPRRLVSRVGIDKLLVALARVKRRIPDVWLAIAGKGPLQASLQKQAIELDLNEHVKFLGFLLDENLSLAYQAADLSVLPSQALEGFGLALVESLACGTPVLCTPVGGMPEILTPFSSHLIADSSEAVAIAERIEEFLLGKVSIPSREDCHEYAFKNFDLQKVMSQVRKVLIA